MLAEDDLINQKVILKILQERGYQVDLVDTGLEALKLFEPGKYDVILMDIQMPEMNGLDATQKIREKERDGTRTPIIALTAYALKGDRERFLALGMDGYISKPIDINNLFYTIEQITTIPNEFLTVLPDSIILTEAGEVQFANKNSEQFNVKVSEIMKKISESINLLESAMEYDNLMLIEEVAHEIKIQSIEIESIEMKDIAFKIELSARRGNLDEALKNIKSIKSEFQLLLNKFNVLKEEL